MKKPISIYSLVLLLLFSFNANGQSITKKALSAKSDVFVVGTLYWRHDSTPVYNYDVLRKIITAIQPDVFVLDATPTELKNQKVYPGKKEYPEVIFPLVKNSGCKAYPAEPDEPTFTEVVTSGGNEMKNFETDEPESAKALEQFDESLFHVLKASWKSAADVNSETTDVALAAKRALHASLIGKTFGDGSDFWNVNITNVVLKAIKENPGKRIIVLIGVDNCTMVRDLLKKELSVNLIDMKIWLNEHGF